MLETMYVRCTHCGYDNSPEYRFCGMCGASLAHPPVVAAPPPKEPSRPAITEKPGNGNGAPAEATESVHGPSFLGLAEDPKTEFHYLYEDEQPRSHAGLLAVVILLLGVGGFLYWQWKHNGFPFDRLNAHNAPSQSASPSEVAPAQSQDQQSRTDKPMTGSGEVLPTAPDNKTPDTGKPTEFPAQGGQTQPPAGNGTASNEAPGNEATPAEKPAEKPTEEAKATLPERVPERTTPRKPIPRTPATKPAPKPAAEAPATKTAPDADLELAGERYLYGTGLPQNCAKAESSLRTAAMHGNSKAETVLGTMYATGHCVGRDLPTAYRWFARALHQDPQNSRISADLQVLWRQMSPQEKQLATSNGQ
jgi:hypothetical protein